MGIENVKANSNENILGKINAKGFQLYMKQTLF